MLGFLKREQVKNVNVNEMDDLIGNVDLIDIREKYEYSSGSIKTAKNIPMGELLDNPEKYLKKDKEYYIMCQSGGRSARACGTLSSQGFNVINVSGGMGAYRGSKRN
ncbi:rhodanese-like domain-containing protein [Clostridium sp. SHJSY1]|uniref:rhodanese-like domain-containing protein n=1 Tax=Clostridium sp. SHJSY1 TaxID=2942483 RepID=UPI00287696E5|nr:rhodanese-like domain-containing protein [Clostridium sp. SHJSY1]MDS0525185.1 rhodanese-like domain-containing protein [Clostridium sp. SHJSY1]